MHNLIVYINDVDDGPNNKSNAWIVPCGISKFPNNVVDILVPANIVHAYVFTDPFVWAATVPVATPPT